MTKRNYRFRALVMMGVAALAAALMVALPVAVQPAYASTTFTVNSTADLPDANLDDTVNVCDADTSSQGEQCTLRAAIGEANYTQGADTITLPAETYTLSRAGDFEDASSTGDLDITDELTITGAGARATIVAGGEAPFDDRIFPNQPGATTTITGLTITGGKLGGYEGGGVNNQGDLTLDGVAVKGDTSDTSGGIYSEKGTLNITDSTVGFRK